MDKVRVAVVNYDKDRSGDGKYNRHVKKHLGEGVIFASEVGSGKTSVRVRPVDIKMGVQKFRMIGRVGVHRWGAVRKMKLNGKKTVWISFHGLHKKSNSKDAPKKYQESLCKMIRGYVNRGFEVVAAGDTNERLKVMIETLGLRGAGSGTMQIFVTDGLTLTDREVQDFGRQNRLTNHEELYITVSTR